MQAKLRWVPVLLPILIELACSSAPETTPLQFGTIETAEVGTTVPRRTVETHPGEFPRPTELEHQVAFWRRVYSEWRRSQTAVHDDRYLDLVYEVIDLPGDSAESYTPEQKALIEERRLYWRDRLKGLAIDVEAGLAPSPQDSELASKVVQAAGDSGLRTAHERVRVQRGLRERFKRGLEISGRYQLVFRKIFRRAGLPEDLAYLPHVESSFQASARSSAGAVGIWQFTRSAAKIFMDLELLGDQRMDPIASARGAARYLSSAHAKLGNWPLALTSYNHGIGGMQRAKQTYGEDFVRIVHHYDHPKFGFASRNFYTEFLAAREIASRPERFFPEGLHVEAPLSEDYAEGETIPPAASLTTSN